MASLILGILWWMGWSPGEHWVWTSLIVLVSLPYESGDGDVYSLWGGVGKNVYSLFGVYQRAKFHAFSLFGVTLYQKAEGDDAVQLLGIVIYQCAGREALPAVGLTCYRKAPGTGSVLSIIGWQEGDNEDSFITFVLYRRLFTKPAKPVKSLPDHLPGTVL
ncbi:hypothetical protein HZC00_04555 [Candidatus Kaiserbacteria bacterium]|nr:hypothetical protein [Candidatus Kaiserbacteria bacterium]